MTLPLWLLSFLSGARSVWSAFWRFISKPPGSYIALVAIAALSLWWFGNREYQRGAAANEAAHVAAQAPIQQGIAIANIGLSADVAAADTQALADIAAGVQHLSDLLSLQQSEISHAFAASNIDARYPVPCVVVRAHDAGLLAVDPASLAAEACGADDAAAPTKASALSAAMLNDWSYAHTLEVLFAAAVKDDDAVRAAWNAYRDKLAAIKPEGVK